MRDVMKLPILITHSSRTEGIVRKGKSEPNTYIVFFHTRRREEKCKAEVSRGADIEHGRRMKVRGSSRVKPDRTYMEKE